MKTVFFSFIIDYYLNISWYFPQTPEHLSRALTVSPWDPVDA